MDHEFRISAALTGRLNRGITAARVDEEGHLRFTMSDGQELDLGLVRVPPETGALLRTGGTMEGSLDMGGNRLGGLAAPGAPGDAATKQYVDENVGGLSPEEADRLADAICLGGTYTQVQQESIQRMIGIRSSEGVGF